MVARQIDNPMPNRPWLCRMARIDAVASLGLLPGPNPVSLRALHSIRRSRHRRELRALLAQPARCALGNAFAIVQVAVLLPVGIYFGLLTTSADRLAAIAAWHHLQRRAPCFRGGIGESSKVPVMVVQVIVPTIYQVWVGGVTLKQAAGFASALLAIILLA